jgi:putative glutamine amidotransferase
VSVGLLVGLIVVATQKESDSVEPVYPAQPVIGLLALTNPDNTNNLQTKPFIDAVVAAGGTPVLIPVLVPTSEALAKSRLEGVDAILVTGGGGADVYPPIYGEEQNTTLVTNVVPTMDYDHLELFNVARARKLPMLGISRGCQLLCVAAGGTLYQDLSLWPVPAGKTLANHRVSPTTSAGAHDITVSDGTFLKDVFKKSVVSVNSNHHQFVKQIPEGFTVSARAPDDIIEAYERRVDNEWIVGIQFHPEMLQAVPEFIDVFKGFIDAADKARRRE